MSIVCCVVEVSATSWSLVQRSPTDYDASTCVRFRNFENEEVIDRVGPQRRKEKTNICKVNYYMFLPAMWLKCF